MASGQREPGVQVGERRRLIVADDYRDVLEGVCALLDSEFEVVDAVMDGDGLIRSAGRIRPDAVVCDVQMPRGGGIEAGEHILNHGLASAVIALSMYTDPHVIRKAFAVGIGAYVLKTDAGEELIAAVHSALRGEKYLSKGARRNIQM